MIETAEMLLEQYSDYASPYTKISRLVKEGRLHKISRGLYETDGDVPPYLLAIHILKPSYISFESALAYYGMIPERVVATFSATAGLHKTKEYRSDHFGLFIFQDIPADAFPLGIEPMKEGRYSFWIASREKAICDKLYKIPQIYNTMQGIEWCLYEDLRLEEEDLKTLDYNDVAELSAAYHSANVSCFARYLKRIMR